MMVSCDKEKLNGLVQTGLRAVSARVTMPILSGLLINADGGKLVVSATDLEMSIRTETDVAIEESGSTVVSGRLIGDIVKSLPGGQVHMETSEKYLTLKAGGGEYRIREMMPEDFPQIPQWEGKSVLKMAGGVFWSAMQQTSRASSNDEKRPVLTGSLVEKQIDAGTIRVVSTDSYRLAWRDIEAIGDVSEWENCIIPTKTLNEVARIAGSGEADVEMKMQEKQVMMKTDGLVVSSRLIEGQFPNYKQLVPKGERTTVKVNKGELMSMIKRALIFGHNLRIGISSDKLRLATETPEVGESKEEIPAEVIGEEMEIGFNGSYLLDGIAAVDTEKVEIRTDDPQKPGLIKTDGDDRFTYILMPVRLR